MVRSRQQDQRYGVLCLCQHEVGEAADVLMTALIVLIKPSRDQ